jgi:hypothetical protein
LTVRGLAWGYEAAHLSGRGDNLKRLLISVIFMGIVFAGAVVMPAGKEVFFYKAGLQTSYDIINWPAEKVVSISATSS